MSAAYEQPILIAGGGIGGLSAAIALARRGIPVRVLEREADFAPLGAGIQIGPNGTRLLRAWGLAPALEPLAGTPEAIALFDGLSGRRLTALPLGAHAVRRYGAPYWVIHRAQLHQALAAAAEGCPAITLTRAFALERFAASAGRLTAMAESGESATGAALIGADGLHSRVRRQLLDSRGLRFSGKTAWRALVPRETAPPPFGDNEVGLWLAPHGHLVHYPVGGGRALNLVAVIAGDAAAEGWNTPGDPAALLRHFARWCDSVRGFLGGLEDWRTWSLMELDPLPRWSRGPVTLIGDAAHPVLPFLASGGVLAIEDAAALAEQLALSRDDPTAAFARYEHLRQPRCREAQRRSRRAGRIYHLDGVLRWARNRVLQHARPARLLAANDWLYGVRAAPGP